MDSYSADEETNGKWNLSDGSTGRCGFCFRCAGRADASYVQIDVYRLSVPIALKGHSSRNIHERTVKKRSRETETSHILLIVPSSKFLRIAFPSRILLNQHNLTTLRRRRTGCALLSAAHINPTIIPLPGSRLPIETLRINAQDTTHVIPIPGDRELAESIPPLVQKSPDSFADFILAVLAMVACAADGVDGMGGGFLFQEAGGEVRDGFFWMQAVQVDVEFLGAAAWGGSLVLVPLLGERFGATPPCLKASWRAFMYAALIPVPVSSQGMSVGAGMAIAAELFSRLAVNDRLFRRPRRIASRAAGPGDGDMRTTSARLPGVGGKLVLL
ncbi:hypothetical protein KC349_g150 [Hortaea werneckii]|nr:hypothetical protein KC349_g150 [Hortaea werneckii]